MFCVISISTGILSMYQLWKAACAYPDALHLVPDGHKISVLFPAVAAETPDGSVGLFGLRMGFFRVEFQCLPLFNGYCPDRTQPYAESHAIAELIGNHFRLAVDKLYCPFRTWGYALSASCTFLLIDLDY